MRKVLKEFHIGFLLKCGWRSFALCFESVCFSVRTHLHSSRCAAFLIGGRSDMPKRSTWRRIFFCRRFIGFLKLRASPSASRWLVSRVQSRLPALAKRRILLRRALAGICPPLCSRDELLASPSFMHVSHRSEHKEYDEYHHMNFSVKMTATFIEIIFDGECFLKFLVKLPLHGEN